MKPAIFLLFCTSIKEAKQIREVLLEKRLIVCGGIINIDQSKYWWNKKYETAKNENLLLMESKEENFLDAEKEIKKIHTHETFVLLSVPVKTTNDVKKWLFQELSKREDK